MIAIFCDFGVEGPYVGQMQAALAHHAPTIPVIPLMVDVPAYKVSAASRLLAGLVQGMPSPAVFLCVVDPGVGSSRLPIAIECDGVWYVGPDNGLLWQVKEQATDCKLYEIVFKPNQICPTFHGRDLFAPVAAELAQGNRQSLRTIVEITPAQDVITNPFEVIYHDRYGNCWTAARNNNLNATNNLQWKLQTISYAPYFAQVPKGQAFWYFNSAGFVEIAVNQGNAQADLQLNIGDSLFIEE